MFNLARGSNVCENLNQVYLHDTLHLLLDLSVSNRIMYKNKSRKKKQLF